MDTHEKHPLLLIHKTTYRSHWNTLDYFLALFGNVLGFVRSYNIRKKMAATLVTCIYLPSFQTIAGYHHSSGPK